MRGSSGKSTDDIAYAEQVRMLYDSMPAAVVANVATSVLFVAVQWQFISHDVLFAWLGASVLVILIRAVLLGAYRKAEVEGREPFWGLLFNAGSTASALVLGSAGVFLFPASDPVGQVACVLVLVGMNAGAVASLSVGRWTFPLYEVSSLGPLVVRLGLEGSQLGYIMMLMTLLSFVFTLRSARYIYTNTQLNIALRVEAVRREQELQRVTRHHELHVLKTPVGVVEWGPDFTVQSWNPACERIFGCPQADVVGRNLLNVVFPSDSRRQAEQRLVKLVHGPASSQELFEHLAADGRRLVCEWSSTRLEDSEGRIVGVASIINDVTASTEANARILAAKEEAEAANAAKSEFLSRMSHELRTPLNAIIGFGQLLEMDHEGLNPRHQANVQQIVSSGRHLLGLINEVLDISRLDSGKLECQLAPVALDTAVTAVVDMVRPMAEQQAVSLEVHDVEGAVVSAESQRLAQVLINLLGNAIKYNRKGGRVSVRARDIGDDLIRLSITDTGIGIRAEDADKLFEPFVRLQPSAHDAEGTGIGLAITRSLVELMGGTMGYASEYGEGSTFWVDLKRSQEAPGPESPPAELAVVEAQGHHGVRRVLYVEDNRANQALMAGCFEMMPGIDLLLADDAERGIELAKSSRPDLVLMDINLPGMDGFQALQVLKQDPVTAAIPVVAVSADAMDEQVQRGRESGFEDYLTKPVDVAELQQLVQRF